MITARDLRAAHNWFRAGGLLPIVALGLLGSGCAGWNATGERRAAWSMPSWKRPDKTADAAGYDLYADAANTPRPMAGDASTAVVRQDRPRAGSRSGLTSPPDSLAAGVPASSRPDATSDRSTSKQDTSIRVTLGRPESLPTVGDPEPENGSLLASAPATNWKRSGEPSAARRVSSTRAAETVRRSPERRARPQGSGDEPVVAAPRADDPDVKLRDLLAQVRARLDAAPTYRVDITRVERVGGQLQAEEDVVLNIRRHPKAVLLQWAKGASKGREVIYSTAVNDRMIYVNMGNSSLPLPRMTIPVDSPMVMRNSRHPISEAGFDTIIDNLVKHADPGSVASRAEGKLIYKGIEKPRELDHACHRLARVTPQGETWEVYLDTTTLMPALVTATQTSSGDLIERYVYRNFKPNPGELASTDAFNPDKRWGESKGFLSRLAKAAAATGDASSAATTTR